MNIEVLKRVLKEAQRGERHNTNAETRYWCSQYKAIADKAVNAMAEQPAQRTWVGLTDEERRSIREWQRIQEELGPVWSPMMLYLYEAIEAKLKEKNT